MWLIFCEFMQITSIHERREEVMQKQKCDTLMECDALCSWPCSSCEGEICILLSSTAAPAPSGRYMGENLYLFMELIYLRSPYWHSCAQEYRWLLCLRLPASRSTHSRCRNSSFSCLWIREADFSSCYYLFNVQTNNRIRIFAGRHATHSLAFRLHQWQCLRIS